VVLTTAEGLWEALKQSVAERRPLLADYMQHGNPLTLDKERLSVRFAATSSEDKFSFESLREPENLEVVRDAARTLLGRPLRIDLELGDTGAVGTNGASGTGTAIELEAGAREELQRHKNELKQAVLDIFGATPI